MEAATFRQILPHTHASRLTPAWGQTARKQFIPHADAAFLSLDRIRSTSTCSWSSSRLGAASTAVYGVRVGGRVRTGTGLPRLCIRFVLAQLGQLPAQQALRVRLATCVARREPLFTLGLSFKHLPQFVNFPNHGGMILICKMPWNVFTMGKMQQPGD